MILSSEFNKENIRTIPINMTEWQEKQLAEQYFHLWMLSSIKFPIRWKNWLVFSNKKSCFLQVNRTVSIKAFSPFKRLSSLWWSSLWHLSTCFQYMQWFGRQWYAASSGTSPTKAIVGPLKRDKRVSQLPLSFMMCISMLWYAVVYTQSN